MRLPRLLLIPLLMSMGIAPGVAQSPQRIAPPALPDPFVARPLPGSRIPPLQFHAQTPNAKDSARGLNSRTLKRLNPFVSHPNDLYALNATPAPVRLPAPGTKMMLNNERCYTIRDYQFSRVAPESDATRLSGSSTCEPASQVRLKGVTAR